MIADESHLLAYRNGLWAASFLKRHFPDRFEQHVARQPVTIPFLLCVAEYFLILANQHLFMIDEGWADVNLAGDPERALSPTRPASEREAITMLCEEIGHILLSPFPVFWGLPREWESLFHSYGSKDTNILLPAVWRMVEHTNWAYSEGDIEGDTFLEEVFSQEGWATVIALPHLPKETNMDRLCDYLDTQEITLISEGKSICRLGGIIRFILRMTGNGFADYNAEIIAEDFGGQIGFDFSSSDEELRANREAQREAEQIYRCFADLDDIVHGEPQLLIQVAQVIIDAAAHLAANPEPATLVEILGEAEDAPATLEIDMATPDALVSSDRRSSRERPWMKRRAQPRRLPQEDILMDGARPEAQISVYGDGTTLLTRRDGQHGFRCYPISPKVLSQTLSQVPMTAGPLLPNTLGAGWIQGRPWYCLYIPPHTRTLRTLVRDVEREYTFALPPLVWWGWTNQLKIWAVPTTPSAGTFPALDTHLCVAPFPNCNPSGAICWGTAQTPDITTAADLLPAFEVFFRSYFNDHLAGGKSKAYPVNILLRWNDLEPGAAYPMDDLEVANAGSKERPVPILLSQIISAQWRVR